LEFTTILKNHAQVKIIGRRCVSLMKDKINKSIVLKDLGVKEAELSEMTKSLRKIERFLSELISDIY
jgi:hypothetical protein